MIKEITRRQFITDSSLTATGLLLGNTMAGCISTRKSDISSYDIMKEVMKYRKIDGHDHPRSSLKDQIDIADRLGIEKLSISRPRLHGRGENENGPENPDKVKKCNDEILRAMKLYPDRFIGFFTLNPFFVKESMEEIKLRVDQGFAGFKGYTAYKVNDPLYYPVIEKLIDLKMICYMHAELQLGVGGYRMKYDIDERPNATLPEDMVDAAKRYPEAMFQWAHIASGDFEYICKCFRDYPNIYVDISGSNNDEKQVDFCIEQLGENRIFFGSDGSYYQAVGKILASNATEEQRKKIFFHNYNNVLKKGGHNVD
jgi:predicted TIM-barrel fold metal-dependent hydrolase